MTGFGAFVVGFGLLGNLLCCSDAWQIHMPRHITGLLDSCLTIPCSFSYDQYYYSNVRPDRIVWYQYKSRGYPVVCDPSNPYAEADIFKGKTRVFTSSYFKKCTLLISPVTWYHDQQKIYPWVDPVKIGSMTYKFYHDTVTINVVAWSNKPDIQVFGSMKVGESVTVQCSVVHSCSHYPPTLSLSIPVRNNALTHETLNDGTTKTILRTMMTVTKDYHTVMCSVQHLGGRTASATHLLSAECSKSLLVISTTSDEFLEGHASRITCTASYTCSKDIPTLSWNDNSMVSSTETVQEAGFGWRTISTLTLMPSANDHGRYLKCTARFADGQTQGRGITLRVKKSIASRGWSFTSPDSLTGMRGSCIVIPCKFSYITSKPNDLQAIWYLYARSGYPAVFDQRTNNVVGKFVGRTRLIGSMQDNNCSLKIDRLEMSYNRDQLYPWIDKDPITSYHTMGQSFDDKTTQLIVLDQAEEPKMSIAGVARVGEQSKVSCSVQHACLSAPPTLTISGIPGSDHILNTLVSEGIWERTVERTWTVQEEDHSVKCSVAHPGGQKASSARLLNVECPFDKIVMVERLVKSTDGVAISVICSVTYKCQRNAPVIEWNYGSMQSSLNTKKISRNSFSTLSNLTFIGSSNDDGKNLTCTAKFLTGKTSDSATIHINRNILFRGWSSSTLRSIAAMKGSCVVIPCRFSYSIPQPRDLQVVWYLYHSSSYPTVFNQKANNVIGKFIGKTSLIGSVRANNCSLKIEKLEMSPHSHDRLYPWIDEYPVTSYNTMSHSFYDETTQLIVSDHAEEPKMSIAGVPKVGEQSKVSCSVQHACLSAPPTLTISGVLGSDHILDTLVSEGIWERTVERTWTVQEEDHSVKCSVTHPGGQKASSEHLLNVECPYDKIKLAERRIEATESVAISVICTVSHKCQRNIMTIVWNYRDMPSSLSTKKQSKNTYTTTSNLTFIGSPGDDGKTLTCTAQFKTGETSDSATIQIKRNMANRGWSFTSPDSLTGMRGSCIVIPCKFSYITSKPSDLEVHWYLYMSSGSIGTPSGITSLIGSVQENNCSLKIETLRMSHSHQRLYPWIDRNSITSYATADHSFYDKTTELIVSDQAEKPRMSIAGVPKVGEQSKVSCSVQHTCLSAPPTLTISGVFGLDHILDTLVSEGIWERTVERTWTVEEEDHSVKCSVTHPGGQKASSELTPKVECPYDKITMVERPGEIKEGREKSVLCTVSHKCQKNTPLVMWNYKNKPSSQHTIKVSGKSYTTASNLTLTGSPGDDGKTLTCTAHFEGGETSDSATIRTRSYQVLAADVPITISALTRSCVVVPCSFQDTEAVPMTRGIWSKKTGGVIFHNGQSRVLDHFKGRTRLLGALNEGNCTMEIDDVKPFDNGPFCFHAEKGDDKYLFNNSCVFLLMRASPEKPVMTPVPAEADAGSAITVSCTVSHTCPSRPPVFSWSVPTLTSKASHTMTSRDIWEINSTITFLVPKGDGPLNLICTATFRGGKQQTSITTLNVKGSLLYQVKRSAPVAIPVSLLVLIVVISAAVFGVCMWRKRKQVADAQSPPPRPEKRRSLWDRVSRRFPEGTERPPRPEKRKSLWGRLSRRIQDDRVGWNSDGKNRRSIWNRFSRRQGDTPSINLVRLNNFDSAACDTLGSKPLRPPPTENFGHFME